MIMAISIMFWICKPLEWFYKMQILNLNHTIHNVTFFIFITLERIELLTYSNSNILSHIPSPMELIPMTWENGNFHIILKGNKKN